MDLRGDLNIDILELCHILQAVGFEIKNISKDVSSHKTETLIEIKCNISGISVVLENDTLCTCPYFTENDDNEKWEMSGTSGGIQISRTENASAFHKTFSEKTKIIIKNELTNLIKTCNQYQSENTSFHAVQTNFSLSSSCLHTSPSKINQQIKMETPDRYRSLDTLNDDAKCVLPKPRVLSASQKSLLNESNSDTEEKKDISNDLKNKHSIVRQNTYVTNLESVVMTEKVSTRSRTSSPLRNAITPLAIFNLHQAEKLSTELMALIQESLKSMKADIDNSGKDSFISNVSKISNIKSFEPRARTNSIVSTKSTVPYWSSPNLSKNVEVSKSSVRGVKKPNYKTIPSVIKRESKTNVTKYSFPRKFSSITSLNTGSKKSNELGTEISGTYKPLEDKSSAGNLKTKLSVRTPVSKDNELKKKSSLYGHIKSTIPRHIPLSKKKNND